MHRVQHLLGLLPNALAFGYASIDPELEALVVSCSRFPVTSAPTHQSHIGP
jgi:hypothetical protein